MQSVMKYLRRSGIVDDDMLMTKREKIAAMALQGLLSQSGGVNKGFDERANTLGDLMAERAVRYADALIAEIERTTSLKPTPTPSDGELIERP